ncbi:MAG: hypothetical protein UH084_06485 [Paludibacteraceae bacterium]|nr:hypothetical protein [Paludibacteraceae bacterium]
MKRILTISLWALIMMAMPVHAAQSYVCDFENEADRNRWVINRTANQNIYNSLTNKWYIGQQGNNGKDGAYGLYISDDGGKTAHYTSNGCWTIAYDIITLDHLSTAADYTISFDYMGMGNVASNFDGLYLLWVPMLDPDKGDSIKVMSIATSANKVPPAYENYIIQLQPNAMIDYVNATSTWKQCIATIPNSLCDGTPHYLAFVWANGASLPQQPGAKIDNIAIMDTRACDVPTGLDIAIQGTTTTLSWQGTVSEYEVSAYSYEADQWFGPKTIVGTTTSFANLPIGQTDFIVRSKCADDLYSLKTTISKLVYYPDQMCVDYLNLDNATCYINNSSPKSTLTFSDFKKVTPVDDGPAKIGSRHTIHFDKNEIEPRTGGLAKTIPDGELASIRLGNWDSHNEAERIEFSFEVDTMDYPVLLLKYMPLLEAPGHLDHENPRFKLDILINGKSIGECGKADFNCNDVLDSVSKELIPEAAEQGWHITPAAQAQTQEPVVWKEWTTVGVNLKNSFYHGKKLTVRLTTHDCTFSVHCGYAYFTLGCSDGKLKGMKCGAINPVFEAPDGFNYRWMYASSEKYRAADGSVPEQYVLGRDQIYEAGMQDDSIYVVDCIFVQDSTCYFSLYASTLATNPVAVMSEPQIQKNCQEDKYTITFDASKSWVQEIDHVINDTLVSQIYKIDRYEWNIEGLPGGWSDQPIATFDFPREGGDYLVSLRTTCGTCDSIIYYNLHLDSVGPTRDTTTVVLCDPIKKTGYTWSERPDTVYYEYGLDSIILYSPTTSCDSIKYLNLVEPVRIYVDTMVLPEQLPFSYRGRQYTQTMVDTIPISENNCDTTWIFNFEVYESLIVSMPNMSYVLCEGDSVMSLVYDITRGRSLRYSYAFKDGNLPSVEKEQELQTKGHYEIPITLGTLYPNVYEGQLLLEDSFPKWNITIPFTLTVQYASDVIAQRWNDVLAIRNAEYNGGYEFDSVQWYLNGAPIVGAMSFNYYTGGDNLQFGAEYSALLTREDGVKLFTCPFVPQQVAIDAMPQLTTQIVNPSAQMPVKGTGTAYWYDMLGRVFKVESYNNTSITAPSQRGYYLLILQSSDALGTTEWNTRSRVMVQ